MKTQLRISHEKWFAFINYMIEHHWYNPYHWHYIDISSRYRTTVGLSLPNDQTILLKLMFHE